MGLILSDLFLLLDVESRLVAIGPASYADRPDVSALEKAGYLSSPAPGFYVPTGLGWSVVHAFRKHLAAHREAFNATAQLPAFVEPAAPDERANRCDLAERAFVAALAVAPFDVNVAGLADRMLQAADTFIARSKAGGL